VEVDRRGFHSLVAKIRLLCEEILERWEKIFFKDKISQSGYFGILETVTEIEQALALSCSTTTRGEESNGEAILSVL